LFNNLSDRLTSTFRNLRTRGRLSEADVDATVREIRRALLDADVAVPVVRQFTAAVRERALGAEVSGALNPAQQVVQIVNEELVGILGGLAFGLPVMAYSAQITEDKGQFSVIQRFIFMPLFLFSGTFYPLNSLPLWLQWIGWISPVWHVTEIGRALSFGATPGGWPWWTHLLVLVAMTAGGAALAWRSFLRRMSS